MEFMIELLNAAEKQGILTGGTDDNGNAAFIVVDSTSLISLTIRPGDRASLIISGEETNYDLGDEDGVLNFIEGFAEALVGDNLDHKASALIDLINEMTDEEDGDYEPSSGDEEDEESEEDDTSDEEEESEEDVDDEDVEAEDDDDVASEEDDEEEASPREYAAMGLVEEADVEPIFPDDSDEDEPLNEVELSLLVDNFPFVIDNMLETAAKGEPEPFQAGRFTRAVTGTKAFPQGTSLFVQGGSACVISLNVRKQLVSVELRKGNTRSTVRTGRASAELVKAYKQHVLGYAMLNNIDATNVLTILNKVIASIENDFSTPEEFERFRQLCCELNRAIDPKVAITNKTIGFELLLGYCGYKIGYRPSASSDADYVFVTVEDKGGVRTILEHKADYMVGCAAAFAKASTILNSAGRPNALILNSREGNAANLLMRIAVRLGYKGESETRAKLKVTNAIKVGKAQPLKVRTA